MTTARKKATDLDEVFFLSGLSGVNEINFESKLVDGIDKLKSLMKITRLSPVERAICRDRARNELPVQGVPEDVANAAVDALGRDELRATESADIEWSEPRPLPPLVEPVPKMTPDYIPEPLRKWLTDSAEHAAVPLECIAASIMVSLSSVVGNRLGIRPEKNNPWVVIPNLWGGDISKPGQLKTERAQIGQKPLRQLIKKAHEKYETVEKENRVKRAVTEAKLQAAKRRKDISENEITKLMNQIDEYTVRERRYLTSDSTPEKLADLLSYNHCILVSGDELTRIIRGFDKQGREGEREFYLEGWNGNNSFTIDRIGRGTIYIHKLCLCVYGTAQPDKIKRLINETIGGSTGNDGLLSRFQLLVWPDSLPEWKRPTKDTDFEAENRAYSLFEKINELNIESLHPFDGDPPYIRFDASAQAVFSDWRDQLELRLRNNNSDFPAFDSHIAKFRSLCPSLALLFELIEWTSGAFVTRESLEVSTTAVQLAIRWCDFLEGHAKKLYAPEINKGRLSTWALAGKIQAKAVFDGVTLREIYRSHWEHLNSPEDVYQGLSELENLHWLKIIDEQSPGGRPRRVIRVNPAVFSNSLENTGAKSDESRDDPLLALVSPTN
jgi:hypothetical protein